MRMMRMKRLKADVEKDVGAVKILLVVRLFLKKKRWMHALSPWQYYACTAEEGRQHFQSCGTVNRVTILTDMFGQPKGFAYVEFVETDAVENAILFNESERHGRQLKVSAKRTNIPGMKQYRGSRPRLLSMGSKTFLFSPRKMEKPPRFRRPMRNRPYYKLVDPILSVPEPRSVQETCLL